MGKTLPILVLAFAFLAVSVTAQPAFNIVESSVSEQSDAGRTQSFSFTVNNTGTTSLNINFTGLTLTSGSNTLSITSLTNTTNLANGSQTTKSFSVVVPQKQQPGTYAGTITATSNASPQDTLDVELEVNPTHRAASSVSSLNLGSVDLGEVITRTFTLANDGNADITGASISFTDSDFNLRANKSGFTLPFNKSEKIRFNITIPSITSTGNVTLGSVRLNSNELNKNLFPVRASIGGGLNIDEVDVFLTTRRSESGSDKDIRNSGKRLDFGDEDAGPGSRLKFNIRVENTFQDEDADTEIQDVQATVTIEEIDDGDEIDEESEEVDLEAGNEETLSVEIDIPLEVDEGVFDVLIGVEGDGEGGTTHKEELSLELEIDKESRDVIIKSASMLPQKIQCSGTVRVSGTIQNLGSNEEDQAVLEVKNDALGVNLREENIELEEDPFDSDSRFSRTFAFPVERGTEAGTYEVKLNAYIRGDILWESETFNLEVERCSGQAEQEESGETEGEKEEEADEKGASEKETGKTDSTAEGVPVLKPDTTEEIPLTERTGFWIAFAVANVVLIGGLGYFVYTAVRK